MIKYKWTKSINLNLKYVWRVYDNTEIMSAWRLVLVSERTEGGLHGRELSGPLSCFWNVKLVSLVMCSSNWKLQFTIFLVLIIQFPPEAESSNLIIIAKVSCLHNSHKLEGSERKVKSQSAARKDVLPSKRKGRDQTTIKKTLERQTQFFLLRSHFWFYILYCCWPFSSAESELYDSMPEIWSASSGPVSYDVLSVECWVGLSYLSDNKEKYYWGPCSKYITQNSVLFQMVPPIPPTIMMEIPKLPLNFM